MNDLSAGGAANPTNQHNMDLRAPRTEENGGFKAQNKPEHGGGRGGVRWGGGGALFSTERHRRLHTLINRSELN